MPEPAGRSGAVWPGHAADPLRHYDAAGLARAWRTRREFPMLSPSAPENSVAQVTLASALARWLPQTADGDRATSLQVPGATVGEVFEGLFARYPGLRGYVVDERGAVRPHVAVFVDGNAIHHNSNLQQALGDQAEIHVMQALSGG